MLWLTVSKAPLVLSNNNFPDSIADVLSKRLIILAGSTVYLLHVLHTLPMYTEAENQCVTASKLNGFKYLKIKSQWLDYYLWVINFTVLACHIKNYFVFRKFNPDLKFYFNGRYYIKLDLLILDLNIM